MLEHPIKSRSRCYACFRPAGACFCHSIPTIDNQTEVLIVQHRRERFHPFNTARIVHKALCNSQLLVDHTKNLARRLQLKPRAALLYPGPTAEVMDELPHGDRPEQLVIVDGTWHHAKTLVREIPMLRGLPRYRLEPTAPSRYRIRLEPHPQSLSTLEATVAALRILEPETAGLELLLKAFDTMVEGQLGRLNSANGERVRKRPNRTFRNIPLALLENLDQIVVAYAESPMGGRGRKRMEGPPISCVAQRLGSGEMFSCLLRPVQPLSDVFLNHLALSRADFADALSLEEAQRRWAQFCRPNDVVAVYYPGTARLLSYLGAGNHRSLVLKSVDLKSNSIEATWNHSTAYSGPPVRPSSFAGRAGYRLANTIGHVQGLIAVAKDRLSISHSLGITA